MKYQGGRSRAQRTRNDVFRPTTSWFLDGRCVRIRRERKRNSTTQFRSLLNSRESEIGCEMAARWPFHTDSSAIPKRKATGLKASWGCSADFHRSGVTQIASKGE